MKYIITGSTPSSKNSKRWTGKRLINNLRVMDWYKHFDKTMLPYKEEFIKDFEKYELPIELHVLFIRKDNRIFDYINPMETLQDALVKYGYIQDDNYKIIKPVFHNATVDKENACCIFWIDGLLKNI